MTIARATEHDYQELKDLWSIVFQEDPAFLEHFFAKRFFAEHIFTARVDGKLVSALHALPASYQKEGDTFPCSYIVGAATYREYRRQGIMGRLLYETAHAYDHPITLFPAVRPFYEANGYTTTSSLASYSLEGFAGESVEPCPVDHRELDRIYRQATAKDGALLRDGEAWKFLTEGYETVCVEDGYAFLSEHKAVETFALHAQAAKNLINLLAMRSITTVYTLSQSEIARLFPHQKAVPIPMGMSTANALHGVYIAEQY
ncbi:MAG: GNAT family N-acetyltransferase [Sphaerochaeta sp.]|uniref:GNAT family N-acetyltransferase n=1 Tax=Sphaerochaeta sp. TaxID=1972642 RepID=UPI003D12C799